MKLSIVTTLFYSAPYIEEFYKRIKLAVEKITNSYEIIFVNDGSPDNSLELVLKLKKSDNRIIVIDLSRNFGHHKALMTGISNARGDFVFLIDSDLEEEPELLRPFWNEINNSNDIDVVFGIQKTRKGGIGEKIFGYIYYKIFNIFSEFKLPVNLSVIRIMTKRYVKSLIEFNEEHIVFAGLCVLAGYNQKEYGITKGNKRKSAYTIRKKIQIVINSITSFSARPLVMIFYLGSFISFVSLLYILYVFYKKVFYDIPLGWTSIVLSIWFFGGLIILCIGIVGIYISKIYEQSKQRPFTILKRIYK